MPAPSTACYTRNPRSIGMRKRFVNMLTPSKKKTDTSLSTKVDVNEIPSTSPATPIRFISPRATDSVPVTPPHARQRTFSFVHRQTHRKARMSQDATDLSKRQPTEEQTLQSGSHVPVTDIPHPEVIRNDSVAMPNSPTASPTKGAALTSHPVSVLDEVFSDASEKFVTPMSGRSMLFDRK
ncbi:hypothetical protein IQ06DRAFT_347989 [Phaeosphaeriaceae sp. SRC1lsM3a]|nr:hypothetical protein IQ06DRAFT_347989 [Stagonospora sp. SRC1lsM3a]